MTENSFIQSNVNVKRENSRKRKFKSKVNVVFDPVSSNKIKLINTREVFKVNLLKMESTPLDFVAQCCMDLTDAMSIVQSESERDALITYHIKKVWSTVTPIEDFKKSKLPASCVLIKLALLGCITTIIRSIGPVTNRCLTVISAAYQGKTTLPSYEFYLH